MKNNQRKAVKLAMEYLDSFLECEQNNSKNCPDCGLSHTATDVVDFGEAHKALDLLNAEFDFNN